MKKEQFSHKSKLSITLAFLFIYSCSGIKRDKYVSQIKENLPIYDSITAKLIAKYSNRSIGNSTIIYPSEKDLSGDYFRFHDSSIYEFCNQNDISYIQIYSLRDTTPNAVNVTYYLHDTNFQYIFESNGVVNKEFFENTRVLVIPINKNWTFQYEKPNF